MRTEVFCFCFLFLLSACSSESKKPTPAPPLAVPERPDEEGWPNRFGFGEEADEALINKWNMSIAPDGKGLPAGRGSAKQGAVVYQAKCASCHGPKGWDGPFDPLVIEEGAMAKTIGNYWPYATTIFDYIRRAMPYNAPGSLSNEEVYQLTAFLLYANGLLGKDQELNATTLPKIEMPAKKLFVPDDRRGGREIR
ncbi:c-type cytochrome [Olivibacter sp. XZL3]|uniref:c-type cytochrome n=1 Tax=Olivibacter sp. XZL3 TaxID=1735116 RepID=UPI001066D1F0|nr:cytochrome c [Olivibacter sp. XZL3]